MRSLNQGGSLRRAPETGTPNASAAGVYDRRLNVYNLKPYHLRRTRAALAKARAGTGKAHILMVGDSTTGGVGAGTISVNDWPANFASMLNAAGYPLAGSGFVAAWKASAKDSRWGAIPAAWQPLSGYDNLAINSTTADPLVFTSTNTATTLAVYYANTGGPFTVSVDSGTAVAVTPVGGNTMGVYPVTGLANTTHTISIVRTSGNVQIFGVEVGTGNGVSILNGGIGGQKINPSPQWFTTETIGSTSAGGFNADLAFLMMETNDAGVTATATYKASMQGVITVMKNNGSDVVLVTAVPSSGKDFTAFNQALYELADANDIPLVDLQDRLGTYALSNGYGLMSDTLHPNSAGYAEIATALFAPVVGQAGAMPGAQIAADQALSATFGFGNSVTAPAFGAKNDGSADASAAIQAAHDALPANGGRIIFPKGKYLCNSTVTFTKPVTLVGEGSGDHTGGQGTANTGTTYTPTAQGSVIFTTSQTIDVFVVNASGFAATDLAVVNTAASAPTAGTGIRVTRGDGAHLTRVRTAGFWNNVSFEQSEYATFTNCMFIDPVNYGLWTRNLVQADQGDMTLLGCAFSFSGSVNRTGATAIRWESGGGLKLSGNKINMGPRGGVGKYTYGIYLAVADGASTSVFVFNGNSFENTTAAGILARPLGTTGQISKMTIIGNEFSANGVAIDVEGYSAALPFKNLTIDGNHVDGSTNAIYLKNVNGFAIGPNNLNVTVNGILIDTGCQNGVVGRQVVLGSTSNVIQNNSSTLFADHTTGPVDVDWHDKRNIPTTTSTSVYTNLHAFGVSPYAAGVVEVTISAIVQGVGSGTKVLKRSFTRGSSGVSSVATIGTDVASGANFDVNFDTSSTAGNVVAQIRLNSVTGGTDINGSSTIDIKGDVNALNRN